MMQPAMQDAHDTQPVCTFGRARAASAGWTLGREDLFRIRLLLPRCLRVEEGRLEHRRQRYRSPGSGWVRHRVPRRHLEVHEPLERRPRRLEERRLDRTRYARVRHFPRPEMSTVVQLKGNRPTRGPTKRTGDADRLVDLTTLHNVAHRIRMYDDESER